MKKILSVILSVVLIASALTVFASAKGTLILGDDFSAGFKAANWVIDRNACHFEYDDERECIFGYYDAVFLQPNYTSRLDPKKWDVFYAEYTCQYSDYGEKIEGETQGHAVGLWYKDLFENESAAAGPIYEFTVNLDNMTASLHKELANFTYKNESDVDVKGTVSSYLANDVDISGVTSIERGENAPYFTIGIRVTVGKIECYVNGNCVITSEVNPADEKVGPYAVNSVDATVGTQKCPVLLHNTDCYISIFEFNVWTPDYDFPTAVPGDVNGDEKINISDALAIMKYAAQYDIEIDLDAADVNADGKVNISDAVKIMKYVAGYEGIVLGEA